MLSIITLPSDFVASTTAYVGELWTDVVPLIALVIGLPLAFWVVRRIIGLVRAR